MSELYGETSFREEGFLRERPGWEFRVHGHAVDNLSGLLVFKAVAERTATDPLIEAANRQGLRFSPMFDDEHPGLVMLETIGLLPAVEHLAKDLAALEYHRIPEFDQHQKVPTIDDLPDFLTDEDIAGFLHKSAVTVQRMRLQKGLPYLPGRPPMVMKADLLSYLEQSKSANTEAPKIVKPIVEFTQGKLVAEARQWVLKRKRRAVRVPRGPNKPTN